MLKMSKSFVVRMVLWTVLVGYLALDFLVFSGPLKRELRRAFPTDGDKLELAIKEGICARVHSAPIYLGQVERRVQENLWRAGRKLENVGEKELKLLRWVALNELIDEHLVRIKVRVNREEYVVSDGEIDAELERFKKRFGSGEEMEAAMEAQGIESGKELRYRLAARLQQEKYVEKQIEKAIAVGDAEVRAWYDENKEEMAVPERRRVRHIFMATLDHPSDEAKGVLESHLTAILEKKVEFAKVAAEVSEDLRSKKTGGDLGWMRKDRLPGDFAAAVFAAPRGKPFLFRTKLGWHIAEVTEVKGPEIPSFDLVKDEIRQALSDSRRKDAVDEVRRQLRYLEREKVVIYKDVLDSLPNIISETRDNG